MTATMAEEIESIKNISVISDVDLVGEIWENRPLMCCKPVMESFVRILRKNKGS